MLCPVLNPALLSFVVFPNLNSINGNLLLNNSTNLNNESLLNNENINNTMDSRLTDIYNNIDKNILIADNKFIDNSLKARMLRYRKLWNKSKLELEKDLFWDEEIKSNYYNKVIEKKYKALFKKYVLSIREDKLINQELKQDNNKIVRNHPNLNIKEKILNNYKNLFNILNQKYNNLWNYTKEDKLKMEKLFKRVNYNNDFNWINWFLSNNPNILDDELNIELMQKLLIIMCNYK